MLHLGNVAPPPTAAQINVYACCCDIQEPQQPCHTLQPPDMPNMLQLAYVTWVAEAAAASLHAGMRCWQHTCRHPVSSNHVNYCRGCTAVIRRRPSCQLLLQDCCTLFFVCLLPGAPTTTGSSRATWKVQSSSSSRHTPRARATSCRAHYRGPVRGFTLSTK